MKITRRLLRESIKKIIIESGASIAGISGITSSTHQQKQAGAYGKIINYDANKEDEMVDQLVSIIASPGAAVGDIGESILFSMITPLVKPNICRQITNTNDWAVTNAQTTTTGLGLSMSSAVGGLADSYAIDVWCGTDPANEVFSPDNFQLSGEGISMKMSTSLAAGVKVYQDMKFNDEKESLTALGYAFGRHFKQNPVLVNYYIPNNTSPSTFIQLTNSKILQYNNLASSNASDYQEINQNSVPGIESGVNTYTRGNLIIGTKKLNLPQFAFEAFKSAYIANGFNPITISGKFSGVNGSLVPIDASNNSNLVPLVKSGTSGIGSQTIGKDLTQDHLLRFLNLIFNMNPSLNPEDTTAVENAIRTYNPTEESHFLNRSFSFFGSPRSGGYRFGTPSQVRNAIALGSNGVASTFQNQLGSVRKWYGDAYNKMITFFESYNPDIKIQFDSSPVYTFSLTINELKVKQRNGDIVREYLYCTYTGNPGTSIPQGVAGYSEKTLEINLGPAKSEVRSIPYMQQLTQGSRSILPVSVAKEQQNLLNALRSVVSAQDNTIRLLMLSQRAAIAGTPTGALQTSMAKKQIQLDKVNDATNLIIQINAKIQNLDGYSTQQINELEEVLAQAQDFYDASDYTSAFEAYFTYLDGVVDSSDFTKSSASSQEKAKIAQEILNFKTFMSTISRFVVLNDDTNAIIDAFLSPSGVAGITRIENLLEFVEVPHTIDSLSKKIKKQINSTSNENTKFINVLNASILSLMNIQKLSKLDLSTPINNICVPLLDSTNNFLEAIASVLGISPNNSAIADNEEVDVLSLVSLDDLGTSKNELELAEHRVYVRVLNEILKLL